MEMSEVKLVVEGALLAAREPLSLDRMQGLFAEGGQPEKALFRECIADLQQSYLGRAMELVEVGSGWRIQIRSELSPWISRLWEERPQKYSRALLETLSLIAYKQPLTRGEIEDVRGVAVSSNIIRTLLEREWVRIVGHREVPGRPALYATTREFLDYFNLKSLEQLPSLKEVRDLSEIQAELELPLAQPTENHSAAEPATDSSERSITSGDDARSVVDPKSNPNSEVADETDTPSDTTIL